jgi:hypothetical protein
MNSNLPLNKRNVGCRMTAVLELHAHPKLSELVALHGPRQLMSIVGEP